MHMSNKLLEKNSKTIRFRASERSKRERERKKRINEKIKLQSGDSSENNVNYAMHRLNIAQVSSSS